MRLLDLRKQTKKHPSRDLTVVNQSSSTNIHASLSPRCFLSREDVLCRKRARVSRLTVRFNPVSRIKTSCRLPSFRESRHRGFQSGHSRFRFEAFFANWKYRRVPLLPRPDRARPRFFSRHRSMTITMMAMRSDHGFSIFPVNGERRLLPRGKR